MAKNDPDQVTVVCNRSHSIANVHPGEVKTIELTPRVQQHIDDGDLVIPPIPAKTEPSTGGNNAEQ